MYRQGYHSKLSRLNIGEFRVNQSNDFETGEPIVNLQTQHKIKRNRFRVTVAIVTGTENKRYRISFFKRRRMHDHSSVPFGYM